MPFCLAQLAVQLIIGKPPGTAGCVHRKTGWRSLNKNKHGSVQELYTDIRGQLLGQMHIVVMLPQASNGAVMRCHEPVSIYQ